MMPSFRTVCTGASVLCLALSLVWLVAPGLLPSLWGVHRPESADIVGRRLAAPFLGFGVMLARIRDLPASPGRSIVADGVALVCVILAVIGLTQWGVGHVGPGIALAVLVELGTAWGLVVSVRSPRATGGRPWASVPPPHSEIASRIEVAHFRDAWSVVAARPGLEALDQFLHVARRTPAWIERLMAARNAAASRLGLKDLGAMSRIDVTKAACDYRPGDRAGLFTLISNSADEVLLGDRDAHLDVVVSVHRRIAPADGSTIVTVTTVVHVHNRLGRLYMVPVRPIHRLIARAMVRTVGREDGTG